MIESLIHLIFFLIVAVTIVGSVWLSRKFKERYAEFPWWKAGVLIAVEVSAWVICWSFWKWVTANKWIAALGVVVIIIILLVKKRKKEQIL